MSNSVLRPSTIYFLVAFAFFFSGTLFGSKTSSLSNNYESQRRERRQHPRELRASSSISVDHATTSSEYEHIRLGACSEVPYGTYDWNNSAYKSIDLAELPLNELLIHLDHPAYVSSPNPEGPVMVDIGLYVFGIADLDPGTNTFLLEGYLDLLWCDARVKFDESLEGTDQHIFLENDAAKEIEHIWWPAITFINEVTERHIENQELIIFSDGTIEYREKFGVTLTSNFDMVRFPFDKQTLVAEIESFAWNSNVMEFHIEEDLVGFSDEFSIPEHRLTGIEEHLEIKQEQRDRFPFSELVTEMYVVRTPTFYVTKVIVPLVLIVCISWAVFWMDSEDLADRMAISFTGVLTSVAYQFVVSDALPKHIYNTFLDNFVLVSFLIMVLTVFVNIAVHSLHAKGFVEDARMVDNTCRYLFPLMFLFSIGLLAIAQMVSDGLPAGGAMGIIVAVYACVAGTLVLVVRGHLRKIKASNDYENDFPSTSIKDTEEHIFEHDEEQAPTIADEEIAINGSLRIFVEKEEDAVEESLNDPSFTAGLPYSS